jgi:hypothetical protein
MKFVSIWLPERMSTAPPTQQQMDEMGALIGEMMQAGVLQDTGGVMNGGISMRVRRDGDKVTVTDGPFTEAKEVVGGYAVFKVASKDEAVEWTRRFVALAGNGTAELHEIGEFD